MIGSSGLGREKIQVGLWDFSEETRRILCAKTGVTPELSTMWIERAFDVPVLQEQIA